MPQQKRSYEESRYLGTNDPRFASIEPSPKKQRIETPLENDTSRNASTRSSLSHPGPKTHTTWACGLWALCNPGKKPTEQIKQELSDICDEEDPSVVDSIFVASERASFDQNTPNILTEAACELWKLVHPNEEPARWHRTMLSGVYGGSPRSVSNWFTRKQANPPGLDDSGHGTMTQTSTSMDRDMISRWRCNRRKCQPKHDLQSNLRKDHNKKYMCTSLCGKKFDAKDNWKKHERNNRIQDLWPCDCVECRQNTTDNIWSRKEELLSHVRVRHSDRMASYKPRCIKIPANVRGNCLWRDCPTIFADFEDFLRHMPGHFDSDWVAADLRDMDDETDAAESGLAVNSDNHDASVPDHEDKDEGSPSPNPGSGPSGNSQGSDGHGSGSGDGGSGPEEHGIGNSDTSRFRNNTHASTAMQSRGFSPIVSLKVPSFLNKSQPMFKQQIYQRFASWSPRLDVLRRLGSGATAVVDEVRVLGVSGTLACKTFSSRWRIELFRELNTLSRLQHPHIVALFHGFFRAGFVSFLLQPVADYNLSQYLAKHAFTRNEECNLWLWFSCLTSGLHHMHDHGIVHHDIKPSNILVVDKTVFYSDFGSSTTEDTGQSKTLNAWGFTRIYAAPEVFGGNQRMASDVFSLGCVFLEMVTVLLSKDLRQQLHSLQAQSWQKHRTSLHWASRWNNILLKLSKHQMAGSNVLDLLQICRAMTDPQPSQRPSAAEVEERLNTGLCRSCSYSTKWRSKEASTWPLDQSDLKPLWPPDQSALEPLRDLDTMDQRFSKVDSSIPSRIREVCQTSQRTDQLDLAEASESEAGLPEASENKDINDVIVDHNTEVVRGMMSNYLLDRDQYEKFRASGELVLPQLLNAFRLRRSRYPFYINI